MTPKASHYAAAELIVTTQGLTFALAVAAGKEGDLRTAREMLKVAIANAIAAEFERGFGLHGDGQTPGETK
jgi:hypothetical protein